MSRTHRGEGYASADHVSSATATCTEEFVRLAHLLGMCALERSDKLLGREELLLRVLQIGGIEPPHPPHAENTDIE